MVVHTYQCSECVLVTVGDLFSNDTNAWSCNLDSIIINQGGEREDCGKMGAYIFSYKNILLEYTKNVKCSQKSDINRYNSQ